MTNHDSLESVSLDELRKIDRITAKYRGCRFADLTNAEALQMVYEIRAETELLEAHLRVVTNPDLEGGE